MAFTPAPTIAGPDGKVHAGTVFRVERTGELREVVWAMSAGDFLDARADTLAQSGGRAWLRGSQTERCALYGPNTPTHQRARETFRRRLARLARRGAAPSRSGGVNPTTAHDARARAQGGHQ